MDDDVDVLDLNEDLWGEKRTTRHVFGRHSFSISIDLAQPSCDRVPRASDQDGCVGKAGVKSSSVEQDVGPCMASISGPQDEGGFIMGLFQCMGKSREDENRGCGSSDREQTVATARFPDPKDRMMSGEILASGNLDAPMKIEEMAAAENDNSEGVRLLGSKDAINSDGMEAASNFEHISETCKNEANISIPGPAGRLYQAKQARNPFPLIARIDRRALPTFECNLDVDFLSNAWCTGSQALTQGTTGSCTLKAVCAGDIHGKLDQIPVFVIDMKPNGSDSAFAQLKDPTGHIGGILHSSTLNAHPSICPGVVLVLQKVSVFSPCQSTHYLCIMPENVKEVVQEAPGVSHVDKRVQPALQNTSLSLRHTQQVPHASSLSTHPCANPLATKNIPKTATTENSASTGNALNSLSSPNLNSQVSHSEGLGHSRLHSSRYSARHFGQTMPPPPPRRVNTGGTRSMDCSQEDSLQHEGSSQGKGQQLSIEAFLQKRPSAKKRKARSIAHVGSDISCPNDAKKSQ